MVDSDEEEKTTPQDADDSAISEPPISTSSSSSASTTRTTTTVLWQTKFREGITPYLPPPVIKAIQQADPELEPYVGPEGSITIASTLLLAWFVLVTIRLISSRIFGTGRALADDDEDTILSSKTVAALSSAAKYDATVLLVGPSLAGKTRLFYRLCYGEAYSNMPTLMSLKANVGISTPFDVKDSDGDKSITETTTIRYMDWPGYAPLTDPAVKSVLAAVTTRMVLVLDATQPVAPAADILHHLILTAYQQQQQQQQSKTKTAKATTTKILIACHKSDFPKAKNWRRIKIQMRTELERLLTVHASKGHDEALWWPAGEPLDLEEIPVVQLAFLSTSCEGRLSPELLDFCHTGVLPVESK